MANQCVGVTQKLSSDVGKGTETDVAFALLTEAGKKAAAQETMKMTDSFVKSAKNIPDVLKECLDYVRNKIVQAQHIDNKAVQMVKNTMYVAERLKHSMTDSMSQKFVAINKLRGSPLEKLGRSIFHQKALKEKNIKFNILLNYSKYNGKKLTKVELDKLEFQEKDIIEHGFLGTTRDVDGINIMLKESGGKITFDDETKEAYLAVFEVLDDLKTRVNSETMAMAEQSLIHGEFKNCVPELKKYFESGSTDDLQVVANKLNSKDIFVVKKMADEAKEMYDDMKSLYLDPDEFYLPNVRHGNFGVKVVGKDGELVYWEQFKTDADAQDKMDRLKSVADAQGHTLTKVELDKLNDEERGKIAPFVSEDFEKNIAVELSKMIKSGAIDDPKTLSKAFLSAYKAEARRNKLYSGAKARLAHKRGIAGYEVDNGIEQIAETCNQFTNFIASRVRAESLNIVTHSDNFKKEYEASSTNDKKYLLEFIRDMSTPETRDIADRGVSAAQSIIYAKYLGFNVANGILQQVQAFQNAPIYLYNRYKVNHFQTMAEIARAQKDLLGFILHPEHATLQKGVKGLSADEARMIDDFLSLGDIAPVYGQSLRGYEDTMLGDVAKRVAIFTDRGDMMARASVALATYRLLAKKKIIAQGVGMSKDGNLNNILIDAVQGTNFMYGKLGQMPIARKNKFMRLLATFASFPMHQMQFMKDEVFGGVSPSLEKGDDGHYHFAWKVSKEGAQTTAANYGWSAMIAAMVGGVAAVPFANELSLGQITDLEAGLSEDEANGVNTLLKNVVNHGLLGSVGISMKNKVRFDLTNLWNPLGQTVIKSEYENTIRGLDKLFAGENIKEWLPMIPIPVIWKLSQTASGMENIKVGRNNAYYIDHRDMSIKPLTYANGSGFLNLMGFKTVREQDIRTIIRADAEVRAELSKLHKVYKELKDAGADGAEEAYTELSAYLDAYNSSGKKVTISRGQAIVK